MTVLLTLTTAGGDTGPFNLYSNVDGYTVPFESSVSKAALLLGYASSLVPDAATTVRIQSMSVLCTNYVDLVIPNTTTTTTTVPATTTTTTTICPPGPYTYYLSDRYICPGCTLDTSSVVVCAPTSQTVVIDDYYTPCVEDGYSYKILSTTSEEESPVLSTSHNVECVCSS